MCTRHCEGVIFISEVIEDVQKLRFGLVARLGSIEQAFTTETCKLSTHKLIVVCTYLWNNAPYFLLWKVRIDND
jgi:hypothetical protein